MSEEVEHRLDEFARALAEQHHTRRHVVKLAVGALGAAVAAALPGRASAHHKEGHGGGGGRECSETCKAANAHPHGQCVSACRECQRVGGVFCPEPSPHCCPHGTICCANGGCLGRCRPGTVPDPVTCTCRPTVVQCPQPPGGTCPAGTTCCPPIERSFDVVAQCCPPAWSCCPGTHFSACCPPGMTCQPVGGDVVIPNCA